MKYGDIDMDENPVGFSPWPKRLAILFALLSVVLLVSLVVVAVAPFKDDTTEPLQSCANPFATSSQGMVSSTNDLATKAGVEILRMGGNAVDAFAAVQWMLTLTQPQSCGVGGGLFVLLYNATTGEVLALDGREEAPARFNATSFCKNASCISDADCGCDNGVWSQADLSTGGHPVGVPGTVHATARLLSERGTMTLGQTLAPAIRTARDGFAMTTPMYNEIISNKDRLSLFPSSVALYLSNNGNPIPVGETFRNPDLAATYQQLADEGVDLFYTGAVADDIISIVQNTVNPTTGLFGVMEKSDLSNYKSVYRQPSSSSYRPFNSTHVYTLFTMPPPSSGVSALLMLNMMESLATSSMERNGAEFIHRVLDVQDIAFADRNMYLGDPDFNDVPTNGFLDQNYARSRASLLSATYATNSLYNRQVPYGVPPGAQPTGKFSTGHTLDEHGTTHFSIIDREGNIISCTTTIEASLGSALVVPGRGFLLNNELTDFQHLPANPANGKPFINGPEGGKKQRRTALGDDSTTEGGKRPLSSMTPTIIFENGRPLFALGSPGGSRIISAVFNTVLNLLDYDMCLSDAIATPRVISRNTGVAELEDILYNDTTLTSFLEDVRNFSLQTRTYVGYVEGIRIVYPAGSSKYYEGAADINRINTALALGV